MQWIYVWADCCTGRSSHTVFLQTNTEKAKFTTVAINKLQQRERPIHANLISSLVKLELNSSRSQVELLLILKLNNILNVTFF